MFKKRSAISLVLLALLTLHSVYAASIKESKKPTSKEEVTAPAVLWRNPTDITSRNLFYGPGGKEHEPHTHFTFIKEDLDGTNPKYVLRDEDGVKWKAKLGEEARPETVASRLVWAAGYFANEDYFVPEMRVEGVPAHLHRGRKLIAMDGTMHNVRLKRYLKGEEKIDEWKWQDDPFVNTREYNGLRVLMALINNWDLKDENNAVYLEKHSANGGPERVYMVSDLGASFGTTGANRPKVAKGNLKSYSHSKFIEHARPETMDFKTPSRPALIALVKPHQFFMRLHLRWIGKNIPRTDARWIGQILGRLSDKQIRDAFRAADYSDEEIDGFTRVVEHRIAELNAL
jgi:hypothetical protein